MFLSVPDVSSSLSRPIINSRPMVAPSVNASWRFASRVNVQYAFLLKDSRNPEEKKVSLTQESGVEIWPIELHNLAFVLPNSSFTGAGAAFGKTRAVPALNGGRTVPSRLGNGTAEHFSMPAHSFEITASGAIVVAFQDIATSELHTLDSGLTSHGPLLQRPVGRFVTVLHERIEWVVTQATADAVASATALKLTQNGTETNPGDTPNPGIIKFTVSATALKTLVGGLRESLTGRNNDVDELTMYDTPGSVPERNDSFDAELVKRRFGAWNESARDLTPERFTSKKTVANTTVYKKNVANDAVEPADWEDATAKRNYEESLNKARKRLENALQKRDQKEVDFIQRQIGIIEKNQRAAAEAAAAKAADVAAAAVAKKAREDAAEKKQKAAAARAKPLPKIDNSSHRFFHHWGDGLLVECKIELHQVTTTSVELNKTDAKEKKTSKEKVSSMRREILRVPNKSQMSRRGSILLASTSERSGIFAFVIEQVAAVDLTAVDPKKVDPPEQAADPKAHPKYADSVAETTRIVEQATDLGLDRAYLEIVVIMYRLWGEDFPPQIEEVLNEDQQAFVTHLKTLNADEWIVGSPKEQVEVSITLSPTRAKGDADDHYLTTSFEVFDEALCRALSRIAFGPREEGISNYFP